jgi:hypothetical protein
MSRGKKWLWRLFLLGFVALVPMGRRVTGMAETAGG